MREKDRICILIFYEMALQLHLHDKPHEGAIVGFAYNGRERTEKIANHVLVLMLKGAYKKWKQPVALAFCKVSITPKNVIGLYDDFVKKTTKSGLNVVASVCDHGATNAKAIRLLLEGTQRRVLSKDIRLEKSIILVEDHEIIPLFDVPHLLKSRRNNLLTKNLNFFHNGKHMVAK